MTPNPTEPQASDELLKAALVQMTAERDNWKRWCQQSEEKRPPMEPIRMAYKTGYDEGYSDASDGMVDHDACEEGWQQYRDSFVPPQEAAPASHDEGELCRAALARTTSPIAADGGETELAAKYEACKREAQQWKQEARTANATIAEIYQLCTGKTGEPGNWHGAEPVRLLIASQDELRTAAQGLLDAFHQGRLVYDKSSSAGYVDSLIERAEQALASSTQAPTPCSCGGQPRDCGNLACRQAAPASQEGAP